MKKKLRGSFTIEASFIIPLIFLVMSTVLTILFYYHDKNVLLGTAHETAVYGASLEHTDEDTLENYFLSRVRGKLLLFSVIENEILIEDDEVTVVCNASRNKVGVQVKSAVKRTEPEDYIRSIRKIMKIGEGIGN